MLKRNAAAPDQGPPEPAPPTGAEATDTKQPGTPAIGDRVVVTAGEHDGLEGAIVEDFGPLPTAPVHLGDGSSVSARQFAIHLDNGLLAFLNLDSLQPAAQ